MKQTYTIPDLCAKLGIKAIPKRVFIRKGVALENHPHLWGEFVKGKIRLENRILSVGDDWEMDECVKCGKKKSKHSKYCLLLRKVVSIRLITECECGHEPLHICMDGKKQINLCQETNCNCKQYKPVQKVEIEVKI